MRHDKLLTELQILPFSPVCFVISFEPIILLAYSFACSGLVDVRTLFMGIPEEKTDLLMR